MVLLSWKWDFNIFRVLRENIFTLTLTSKDVIGRIPHRKTRKTTQILRQRLYLPKAQHLRRWCWLNFEFRLCITDTQIHKRIVFSWKIHFPFRALKLTNKYWHFLEHIMGKHWDYTRAMYNRTITPY